MSQSITLDHGSGGKLTLELIENVFKSQSGLDSVILDEIAFTTDSHTIKPLFFKGGDIGKLSVAGTVNDLLCVGAEPLYLSSAFIIEAGFAIESLEKIADSMRKEAKRANVTLVCGDTKVVEKGKCDGVYINTSGIGRVIKPIDGGNIEDGDTVIVTGTIGDHGFAVMNERDGLNLEADIESDVSSLSDLILPIINSDIEVKYMRDPTRGGLAMCMNELCYKRNFGFNIFEEDIPVKKSVGVISEILGIEPYYVANEGKMILVVRKEDADNTLKLLRNKKSGKDAAIIGAVSYQIPQKVILHTKFGSKRIIRMPVTDKMPRIC